MDPTKAEPVQPSVSDVSAVPSQAPDPGVDGVPIIGTPFKEAGPVSADVPAQVIEGSVNEFLTPSNPEVSPPPDVATFASPIHTAQPPQQVINAQAAQIPVSPTAFPTTLPQAEQVIKSKRYSIKDAIKWFATLLKFDKQKEANSTT